MTAETFDQSKKKNSTWETIKDLFSTGSEYKEVTEDSIQYRRKLLDYRIENFLDTHFHDYVRDFGILDEPALDIRSERVSDLEARSLDIKAFLDNADRNLADLETRVSALTKKKK